MDNLIQSLLPGARSLRAYAERLLEGVSAERFARQPEVSSVLINTNHPAFIFGHLSLYPARIMELCGQETDPFRVPNDFIPLFKKGSLCQDDPDGLLYPAKESIVQNYFRSWDALIESIGNVEAERLSAPTEDQTLAARFPTTAAFVAFLLGPHTAIHLGQVSVWRRCEGLGAV